MAQGRGSARARVGLMLIVAVMTLAHPTLAAIYNVGGASGWAYKVQSWPTGKSFRAGDVLAFNYAKGQHNVVAVGSKGYQRCKAPPRGAKVYQSGNDKIRLRRGVNYFICSFPGHCQAGMKIAINAV